MDAYLDEFVFRFNRRTSGSRGMLFHRLLQQAVVTAPVTYDSVVKPRPNDYPDSELDGLSAHIKRLAQDVLEVHVVFNNNMQDQGQRNAASLARRLFALSPDVRSARLELRPGEWRRACKERRGFEATNRAVR